MPRLWVQVFFGAHAKGGSVRVCAKFYRDADAKPQAAGDLTIPIAFAARKWYDFF